MTALMLRPGVVLISQAGIASRQIRAGVAVDGTPRRGVVRVDMSRRAFTITELLVVLLVVAVALAALLPAARRLHTDSNQMVSFANLQIMSFAFAMYSADFDDRQPTYVPDDLGVYAGSFAAYANGVGCPPQKLLGFDAGGAMWGYFFPCAAPFGSWANSVGYVPNTWVSTSVFGAFRLPNSKAFAAYVSGRFWAPEFYAPNDTITYSLASAMFDTPAEFELHPGSASVVYSSYAYSPAAMWHPDVLTETAPFLGWWRNPNSLDHGYQSPTVSQCMHPDLKTRMIEHNWNAGQPAAVNHAFAGGQTPYFFSHGFDAAPITLFFDGHVAELPNTQVVADDLKVQQATGVGLWSRDTPLGNAGYFGNQSWDFLMTGHHVLTTKGIHGRDVLNGAPPKGGVAGAHAPGRGHHRRGLRALLDAPGSGLLLDAPSFD